MSGGTATSRTKPLKRSTRSKTQTSYLAKPDIKQTESRQHDQGKSNRQTIRSENDSAPKKKDWKPRDKNHDHGDTWEIVVLGSGGGPLETDISGYLVKASNSTWEEGFLALEGGSGLGSLASILASTSSSSLFPGLTFPDNYNTPLLQAAYVFSFLTCYLITHAHLDHVGSLIMLSGSVPARSIEHTQPPHTSPTRSSRIQGPVSDTNANVRESTSGSSTPKQPRPHVYGTRTTLEQLSQAYQGGLWPELGSWAPDRDGQEKQIQKEDGGSKRRKVNNKSSSNGVKGRSGSGKDEKMDPSDENDYSCLLFSPLSTECVHSPLHSTLPISLLTYPVVHGCTSRHTYESSAMFIRYDPTAISKTPPSSSRKANQSGANNANGNGASPSAASPASSSSSSNAGREFLFFGDVESSYRRKGEEQVDIKRGKEAEKLNEVVWKEAAKSWKDGRLCGIFLECSYDSSRPAHLMFGHLNPPALYHEMKTLAGLVSQTEERPLNGLKIFIIHIKDALVPHPTGRTAREIIMSELNELESQGDLGVKFVETKRGDRIAI
ncbi:uncharacterized protein IL334_003624 [Kwoniella shivajii]|uniref:3',5'-cyclic-nucleotide phosphodiesterase n=1 Tax=Kwoniella shivajii TaxID=564305 RepID=A0ABZ1CZU9_9TREE|nr:hypothetical protein IL334_003624 [Kwoniella shivajii]